MNSIVLIKDQFEKAFYSRAWHGPSVLESLQNISVINAISKPVRNAHSIWEIVLHITAWQSITSERILGEISEPSPEEDWPEVTDFSQSSWEAALNSLKVGASKLTEMISNLDENKLNENIAGKNYSYYFLINGLIQHNVYHAGQISILKKALS